MFASSGGTQQLLTHLLHKRSSVPSILPHSSPSPYRRYSKDSVPQIDPEEEKLNTASISVQTEEKIRGNFLLCKVLGKIRESIYALE